jgi:hypothetical protein
MTESVFAPLLVTLGLQFAMSKSRLMTLGVLICGIAQARTVNLSPVTSLGMRCRPRTTGSAAGLPA